MVSEESRIGYMCLKDFQYHLENDAHPQRVYPDLDSIIHERGCVVHCGVARVRITLEQTIAPEEFT